MTRSILAAGDNVGASPPNSLLLEDIPTIEALNEIGLDATAFGNHEFDYGVTRIITQQAVANFPWLAANIVEEATGVAPPWVDPTQVFTVNGSPGRRHRRRAAEHSRARLRGEHRGPHVPPRG